MPRTTPTAFRSQCRQSHYENDAAHSATRRELSSSDRSSTRVITVQRTPNGSRVLAGVLPDRFGLAMARMEPYGLIVLLLLLVSGVLNLMPIVNGIRHFILTLFFY